MDARPKSVRLPVRGGSQEAPIPADNFNALWDFGALADGGGIPSWGCETSPINSGSTTPALMINQHHDFEMLFPVFHVQPCFLVSWPKCLIG